MWRELIYFLDKDISDNFPLLSFTSIFSFWLASGETQRERKLKAFNYFFQIFFMSDKSSRPRHKKLLFIFLISCLGCFGAASSSSNEEHKVNFSGNNHDLLLYKEDAYKTRTTRPEYIMKEKNTTNLSHNKILKLFHSDDFTLQHQFKEISGTSIRYLLSVINIFENLMRNLSSLNLVGLD